MTWNAFQKRARQSSHARGYDLGVQSIVFFRSVDWLQNKMPVQIQTSTLEMKQEEATALAHHRLQVGAVANICTTMNIRFVY